MNFIPSAQYQNQISTTQNSKAVSNSVPAMPDNIKMQTSVPLYMQNTGKHPLQDRLEQWESKQFKLKQEQNKAVFGVHLPMKVMMEKQIVDTLDSTSIVNELRKEADLHPATSVHQDIINNKEYTVDYEDIYYKSNVLSNSSDRNTDISTAIENKFKL
ncbi:hypothetical protein FOG51_03235 [Hanseniaspora uvarum]|uniref:Proteasome maturation factor UMP1 n=1 Tax=Hanseniaspora uvarum TaxID=29833 RepID=A0A1E5RUZ7_HANUV|nr:hypothetical protein FOG48_01551 [Hanseniaspora uvarum]KAF0271854.1 hypothetical protein FOG51_03235 [Hanseniaspora uvarum]KAF0277727.1 hypothetical protein FOG50_01417 [Hanseniaspora uvarum]OEJ90543.1 Proteasome maturation factor UMP1 [Hanseniaspora uvarum]